MLLIEVLGVTKRYATVTALDDVSLQVPQGEVFALLGPNGAGKSSILRMLVGITRPDTGRIVVRLDGAEHPRIPPTALGFLPEERGLYQDVPLHRMLTYLGTLRGLTDADARAASNRWLERLGLADRAGEPVKQLSKGNQQKVQFAGAVLHRPAVAVLDEPFSGLDPINQEFFLGLLDELRADGTTVILSAHQMALVERVAARMVLLRRGRVALGGTMDEIRARYGGRSLHDVYLEVAGATEAA